MSKCKKGVLWKDSTAGYWLNGIERTISLESDLKTKKYKGKPPKRFMVTSPKPREIASITFRDRVYQRSLNDNCVFPIMSKSFISANMACQPGKGTDAARELLKRHLRRHYRKYGRNGYVVQFDISGYYPKMSHAVAERTFAENLPPEAYEKVENILREQYSGEIGYNPGSQLIQIAGISVLSKLDHFAKEQLHCEKYVRYMDDFTAIFETRDQAEQFYAAICKKLSEMHFEVNKKKTKIFRLTNGIRFLGFDFRLLDTGKVLMLIKPDNVKAERKRLYRMAQKAKRGEIRKKDVYVSYQCWRDHALKGNNFQMVMRMDQYLHMLMEEPK